MKALGAVPDARAVEPLVALLKNHNVRGDAAKALGNIGDLRAVEPIIAIFWGETSAASEALVKLGDQRAVEPLIRVLNRGGAGGWDVKNDGRMAARALGQLGDPRAVEPLIAALGDKEIGGTAALALGELQDIRAVTPLSEAVKSGDTSLRRSASMALLRFGDSCGLSALLEDLSTQSNLEFVEELCKAVLDYGVKNRPSFVSFLGDKLQSSKNIGVRRYAADLLIRMGESPDKRLLAQAVLDWLEFSSGKGFKEDTALKLMADAAGMDAKLLSVAKGALGYTVNTKSGRSSGGNYSWTSLDSYDGGMSAVVELCQRQAH